MVFSFYVPTERHDRTIIGCVVTRPNKHFSGFYTRKLLILSYKNVRRHDHNGRRSIPVSAQMPSSNTRVADGRRRDRWKTRDVKQNQFHRLQGIVELMSNDMELNRLLRTRRFLQAARRSFLLVSTRRPQVYGKETA